MAASQSARVGIFKCGNIGTAPLVELIIDELADREDVVVRTVTSGSKMSPEDVEETLPKIFDFNPDMVVAVFPNAAAPGPRRAIEILSEAGIPSTVISDGPSKRARKEVEAKGLGYIVVMGDPLIGARKEFLDPTEMAIFNSNVIKVLAVAGVYRMIYQEADRMICAIKMGGTPVAPRLVIDTDTIRDSSDFKNPYAMAKAMAAYELGKTIANIDARACFVEKEREKYLPLVASAHEIAQVAAKLAEEAREMEKESDTLVRRPHSKSGEPQIKTLLRTPPTLDKEVYQRWLKTIEPSAEYTESLVEGPRLEVEEEEPCLRVPPTLDKEVYQRWLKTMGQNT